MKEIVSLPKRAQVLVVGAGVAGLAAARAMTNAGLSVRIIEARDRIGGRIWTRYNASTSPVEMGAEFIHGRHPEIWRLISAGTIPVVQVSGQGFWRTTGGWIESHPLQQQVDRVFQTSGSTKEVDRSSAQHLRANLPGETSDIARQYGLAWIESLVGADPERISYHAFAAEHKASKEIDGACSFRPTGGYASVVALLLNEVNSAPLEVHMSTIATLIRWEERNVEIELVSASGDRVDPIKSEKVLVTVPLSVLKGDPVPVSREMGPGRDNPRDLGQIRFLPNLPKKELAWTQLEMGQVVKVILQVREPFSRTLNMDKGVFCSNSTAFRTWWSSDPLISSRFTGWAAGRSARALSLKRKEAILDEAIQSLAQLSGINRSEIESSLDEWSVSDWHSDPFSRGSYSYVPVFNSEAQFEVGKPVSDTLFFAGEATDCSGHRGTVHGAIASGLRAADEILRSS